VRPEPGFLKLGETTPAQVFERLGRPTSRETLTRNGRPISVLAYLYTTEAEKHHGDAGAIASRSLYLFFHEDRLAGHEFRSNVAVDHTDFDLRKARTIVKARTTRQEVIALLGPPSGYLSFPVIDASLGEAMVYAYTQQRRVPLGAPMVYTKSLVIGFDAHGTTTETFYATSGNP
jgi:hypothetical protein